MKPLSQSQLARAAELLDVIVKPGDHQFGNEIEEAQILLGYAEPSKPKVKAQRKRKRKLTYWEKIKTQ